LTNENYVINGTSLITLILQCKVASDTGKAGGNENIKATDARK